jgi:secondary thiamine-phosphate synthase enzyme
MIEITELVQGVVDKAKVKNGFCIVYCPHTTTAIVITENSDPSVKTDFLDEFSRLVPKRSDFAHAEGNSDAHVKSAVIGNSRTIFIEDGKLVLGTWEGCFFCEFDGPRERKALVKIVKD